jgi:hypothetical protein
VRKLITANISYRVQAVGIDQSFKLATENHSDFPLNIQGEYEEWIHIDEYKNLLDRLEDLKNKIWDIDPTFETE